MAWWIGIVISWIGALGIIAIGAAYLARNATNAQGFGLPTTLEPPERGWWQVKGIRDVVTGLLVIAFTFAGRDNLSLVVGLLAIIPLGDCLIVLGNRGDRKAAFGIHGATAAALVVAAVLLAL